jgi:hypothetical protein
VVQIVGSFPQIRFEDLRQMFKSSLKLYREDHCLTTIKKMDLKCNLTSGTPFFALSPDFLFWTKSNSLFSNIFTDSAYHNEWSKLVGVHTFESTEYEVGRQRSI